MYTAVFASPRTKVGLSTVVESLLGWLQEETSFRVAVFHWTEKERGLSTEELLNKTNEQICEMNTFYFKDLQHLSEEQYHELQAKLENCFDILLVDLPLFKKMDYLHIIESADRLFLLHKEGVTSTIAAELEMYMQKSRKIQKSRISSFRTKIGEQNKVLLFEEVQSAPNNLGFIHELGDDKPVDVGLLGEVLHGEFVIKELKKRTNEKIDRAIESIVADITKSEDFLQLLMERIDQIDIPFQDKLLLQRYFFLRLYLGQEPLEAVNDIFKMYQAFFPEELLRQFEFELNLSKIQFSFNGSEEKIKEEEMVR
ncbi:hypothetical protein ACJ2A9_11580 [Anaerobacillus sp. MEB173]|uniref:hypothetical protein n=1 Tax=Anaerobacillus sp. MEB173 TaxID=3383345 RepID=UPI003F933BAB